MTEILKLNSISSKIYNVLDDKYTVSDKAVNPEAILVRSFSMHGYDVAESVLAIGRAGAGVNNIPIPAMSEKGIVVFNTPGANANAVKELTICGLFLASRNIIDGVNWSKSLIGKGDEVAPLVEKGKGQFGGFEIFGKTLGVVGLGAIGVKVANACLALGMDVVGYDPFITAENKANLNENVKIKDLDSVLAVSDYITLHVPLLDATKNLINTANIEKMKTGASVLNMSRAELVNVNDIKESLEKGKLKCYVVDFPTEPVLNVKGIITIPHLGASTEEAEENCAIMAAEQLKAYLENGNIKNSVNFPDLSVKRCYENRITVAFKNNFNVIENIQETLKNDKISFTSKVKKDLGYAIIDTDLESSYIVEKITDIEGILAIRLL